MTQTALRDTKEEVQAQRKSLCDNDFKCTHFNLIQTFKSIGFGLLSQTLVFVSEKKSKSRSRGKISRRRRKARTKGEK